MSNEQEIADVPLDLEKILEALNATTAHGDDSETSLHTGITQKSDWSYYQNPITSVTEYTDAESGWNKNKGLVAPKIDVVDENQTMKKGNAVLGGEEASTRLQSPQMFNKPSQYTLEEMREYGIQHDAYQWKIFCNQQQNARVLDHFEEEHYLIN